MASKSISVCHPDQISIYPSQLTYPPLSLQLAYKHWHRILRLWPTDLVRPESVSFQHIMTQRVSKIQPTQSNSLPITPNQAAESIKSNGALVSAVPSTTATTTTTTSPSSSQTTSESWNESYELSQTNALYSLLENRYLTANPTPPSLRKPSSDPEYYDRLIRELEEAPSRSWFGGLIKRIKGGLRFS